MSHPRKPGRRGRSDLVPLAATGMPPEAVPGSLGRKLRILGSWSAVAGYPLNGKSRAAALEADGTVVIEVASAQWRREAEAHAQLLLEGLRDRSGERIERLAIRLAPEGAHWVAGSPPGRRVRGRLPQDGTETHRETPRAGASSLLERLEEIRDAYLRAARKTPAAAPEDPPTGREGI